MVKAVEGGLHYVYIMAIAEEAGGGGGGGGGGLKLCLYHFQRCRWA